MHECPSTGWTGQKASLLGSNLTYPNQQQASLLGSNLTYSTASDIVRLKKPKSTCSTRRPRHLCYKNAAEGFWSPINPEIGKRLSSCKRRHLNTPSFSLPVENENIGEAIRKLRPFINDTTPEPPKSPSYVDAKTSEEMETQLVCTLPAIKDKARRIMLTALKPGWRLIQCTMMEAGICWFLSPLFIVRFRLLHLGRHKQKLPRPNSYIQRLVWNAKGNNPTSLQPVWKSVSNCDDMYN